MASAMTAASMGAEEPRASVDDGGSSNGGHGAGADAASTSASGTASAQSGPPYLCPTCQTSYSRLEYLRRHERRHADIRPFVCDCGKGFSRSDVLSRHKRQCAVHLSGGTAEPPAKAGAAGAAASSANGASGGTKKGAKRKSNGAASRSRKSSSTGAAKEEGDDEYGGNNNGGNSNGNMAAANSYDRQQQYMGQYPQQRGGVILPPQPYQQMPMGSVQQQGSFPFPLQPGMSQGGQSSAPLMPPAPYGSEGSSMPGQGSNHHGQGANQPGQGQAANGAAGSPFNSGMSHHLSAINNFVSQQHNYPSSPESGGTHSQHGSPRFMARDMSRHNSGNSRFSLRKSGGSFDHIGPRTSNMNQSHQYSSDFWDALDPAAKTATTGADTDYVSASTGPSNPPLSLADGTGAGGISTTPGIAGLNTPRGDLQRFAVSSGPLSPFSSIALNSTMSPYLSAFSNARDTPFVASPSRGVNPGTPGSSLNVFDWTMRPPSKPASSTQKRDSIGNSAQSGNVTASPSSGKRKREDDEGGRKSPRIQEKTEADLDDDQRSAAELLGSLRNSGTRAQQPAGATEGDNVSEANVSAPQSAEDKVAVSGAPGTSESAEGNASAVSATDANAAPSTSDQSFFDHRNATSGPDAFRLNLQQGGAPHNQQQRGALAGDHGSLPPPSLSNSSNGVSTSSAASAPIASSTTFEVPQKTWDAIMGSEGWFAGTPKPTSGFSAELASLGDVFPSTGMTPLSAGSFEASTKWLMSPGVQQIINSFAPQPGDFGSYFAGATSASGAVPLSSSSSAPSLTTSTTPAVSSSLATGSTSTSKGSSATSAVMTNTQALERALADPKNPFYVSPELFRACYTVLHWDLPQATRLSMLALHAQQNLIKHVPIVHEPTFRLDLAPGCVAFALCMLGCHEHGRQWWLGAEVVPMSDKDSDRANLQKNGNGHVHEESDSKLTRSRYDEEDGQILVRPSVIKEKTDMLIKSFPSRTTSEKDRVSVVQVILLFEIARCISHDERARAEATDLHPTLTSLARKAGIFDVQAEHAERHVHFTPEDAVRSALKEAGEQSQGSATAQATAGSDSEKLWRRWVELAGRRRTAFSIFVLDSVLHFSRGSPAEVQPTDLEYLPLPSPDTIWRAPNVDAWKSTLERYTGPTLGEALRLLLSPATMNVVNGRHGPFARLALCVALLCGVMHYVEHRNEPSDKSSPLQPFLPSDSTDEPGTLLLSALRKWREAWDADELCLGASGPSGRKKMEELQSKDRDLSLIGSHHLFASQTASNATALMDDALPFFWTALFALHATGVNIEDKTDAVVHLSSATGINYSIKGGNLDTSDFCKVLLAAKDFVKADESF